MEDFDQYLSKTERPADPEKKWQPTKWTPDYQVMVAYHSKGLSNIEISKIMDCTPQHVSNILTSDAGIHALNKLVGKIEDAVVDDLEEVGKLAMKRVRDLLADDELYEMKPFAIADRAMRALQGVGKLKSDHQSTNVNNTQNNIVIGDDAVKLLLDGLGKANEASRLHEHLSGDSIN